MSVGWLRFLFAMCVLFLRGQAWAQQGWPDCITPGFGAGGPIFVATIVNTQLDAAKGGPKVTLAISEYLRGPQIAGNNVEVPIDWTLGPKVMPALRMPIWHEVLPEVGKQILLLAWKDGALRARCVVDWSDADASAKARIVGVIKQMVRLSEISDPQKKIQAAEAALSDPEIAVRNFATRYLTSPRVRDPEVRLFVFQHFAPLVADTSRSQSERVEALGFIKFAYDGFSKDTDVNYQILSFIADRMADGDPEVRSNAVQYLGPKLTDLAKRGTLERIHFTDREAVIRQLQNDSAMHGDDSIHARKILEVLGPG